MRDGYLGALAARTLGVAPLLRPVTPSRFEPDAPTGPPWVFEVGDAAVERRVDGGPDGTPRPMAPAEPTHRGVSPDTPLLPHIDPDRLMPGLPAVSAPEEGPRGSASAEPAAADTDTAALGITTLAQTFAIPTASTEVAGPSPSSGFERSIAVAARPGASGTRRDSLTADIEAAAAPPPVIVRIGRIDVRAGEITPRPAPVRQPAAVQAVRSLSDHLAARDRELS